MKFFTYNAITKVIKKLSNLMFTYFMFKTAINSLISATIFKEAYELANNLTVVK